MSIESREIFIEKTFWIPNDIAHIMVEYATEHMELLMNYIHSLIPNCTNVDEKSSYFGVFDYWYSQTKSCVPPLTWFNNVNIHLTENQHIAMIPWSTQEKLGDQWLFNAVLLAINDGKKIHPTYLARLPWHIAVFTHTSQLHS